MMTKNSPLVLDTNILLLDANNLLTLGVGRDIIISEVVLSEIDSKKSIIGDLGYNAREFGRLLNKAEVLDSIRTDYFHLTNFRLGDVNIKILADITGCTPEMSNDRRIIQAALMYQTWSGKVVEFMSNDMLAKHIGRIAGLEVSEFKIIEDYKFEFVKYIVIEDPEVFRTLHYKGVYSINEMHKPENFSYRFECAVTGQVKLGIIVDGRINIIGKDTEAELRRQQVNPCNAEQLLMSRAIQEDGMDIIVVEASAGSGKTVMALSNAMRMLDLHRDKYDNIVYMRNTVDDYGEKDEEVGFLSGNTEKFAVYLGPLKDTLDFMVRDKLKAKKIKGKELEDAVTTKIKEMTTKYNIQDMVALGTRGRTFSDSVIIIDEAQNIGHATMQKLISRIGKNCKVIVIGSNRQIDSKYLTKWNNGMSILLGYCKKPGFSTDVGIFAINLEKTVRSKIAKFAEELFSGQS